MPRTVRKSRRARCLLWLGLGFMLAGPANAADVEHVDVSHDGTRYHVTARLSVAVGRQAAYRAATSFEALADRAELIRSTRRIGRDRLSSALSMCVLFYCKQIQQVMTYRLTPPKAIDMKVVPDAGDLKAGAAHWRFRADGPHRTIIGFDSTIEPAFWVPPMVGDWAIGRALRHQIADTGKAIEAVAESARAAHPVSPDSRADTARHAD
ncbi:hypothetical protein [Salinisphaera sp. Q1T1-3]|uniref:hypothetical protein n=1 Tax=Salinisphaera sp. Q1T1-3 TaxID=2321229 RepID=UPI000E75A37A|nr:hypothetical protein [Salinisphaera sp. Q1T1-3]RJS91211.1 hypothetical protein D3260_16295 [Salinisphaera sp. Q1T1-3]